MKTSKTFSLTLLALLVFGLIYSCQPPKSKKENVENNRVIAVDKAQAELKSLRQQLDSISEDDPAFAEKLERAIDNFNDSIDHISYELKNGTDEANLKLNERLDSVRVKSQDLKSNLRQWTDKTGENMEELGQKIKKNYNEFKESLKEKMN